MARKGPDTCRDNCSLALYADDLEEQVAELTDERDAIRQVLIEQGWDDEQIDAAVTDVQLQEMRAGLEARLATREEPDPAIPEGLSDAALAELIHAHARLRSGHAETYLLPAQREALIARGLVSETESPGYYRPTVTGRALAARLVANMRRKAAEPEPEEQWSEPVAVTCEAMCDSLCKALGIDIETKYAYGYYTFCMLGGAHGMPIHLGRYTTSAEAARAGLQHVATIKGRYDAATDRVRLTGLEVQRG